MQTHADASRPDFALAILRVVVGGISLAHGAQQLFVYGFAGVTGAFGGMHVPAAGLMGPLTGLVEFVGGLALVTGLLTRRAGAALALVMLGAIVFVHLAGGLFAPRGAEYPLALLGALLGALTALAVAGSGRYSLDRVTADRRAVPGRNASSGLATAR